MMASEKKKKSTKSQRATGADKEIVTLMLDTNAVFTKTEHSTNRAFVSLIEAYSQKIDFRLLISAVTLEEIVKQKTWFALNQMKSLQPYIDRVNQVLGSKHEWDRKDLSFSSAENEVRAKLSAFFQELNVGSITFFPTPFDAITFREAFDLAFANEAPFESNSDKGIQDYAILRGLSDFLANNKPDGHFFAVTEDGRLGTALKKEKACRITEKNLFRNVSELPKVLDKILAKVNQRWVDTINAQAHATISDQHADLKQNIYNETTKGFFDVGFLEGNQKSIFHVRSEFMVTDRTFHLGTTNFHSILSQNDIFSEYSFITDVWVFQRVNGGTTYTWTPRNRAGEEPNTYSQRTVSIRYHFQMTWTGRVENGRMELITFNGLKFLERDFENATFHIPEMFEWTDPNRESKEFEIVQKTPLHKLFPEKN